MCAQNACDAFGGFPVGVEAGDVDGCAIGIVLYGVTDPSCESLSPRLFWLLSSAHVCPRLPASTSTSVLHLATPLLFTPPPDHLCVGTMKCKAGHSNSVKVASTLQCPLSGSTTPTTDMMACQAIKVKTAAQVGLELIPKLGSITTSTYPGRQVQSIEPTRYQRW